MVKVRKRIKSTNVCDMNLLIQKGEEVIDWDDDDLVRSIIEEVDIAENSAKEIGLKVKDKIRDVSSTMGWDSVPTSFIREFVSNEILALGKRYRKKANKYNLIGLSPHELKAIIENTDGGENSNMTANNPEAINFNIAEIILKRFILQEVFSNEVANAHYSGMVHVHDAGHPRFYCGSHSIGYIAKNGLKLPTVSSVSSPAKHAEVLVNHILTFSSAIQSQYAGAQGFDAVNTYFAPYLVGMSKKEIKQIAQLIVYGYSQLSTSRGSQCIFSDLNLHIDVPKHLENEKIIGPCGKYYKYMNDGFEKPYITQVKKEHASTYKELESYAKEFLIQIMDVYKSGDKNGLPFSFPKPMVHFSKDSFTEENEEVLLSVYDCASVNGSPYFVYDRGDGVQMSQCCRLKERITEEDAAEFEGRPEEIRFTALQNVTINFPQAAFKAILDHPEGGDERYDAFIENIKEAINIAIVAHKEKYKYLKNLYNQENGPLSFSRIGLNGEPYVRLNNLTYLIGIIGINETVEALTGKQLHESEESYKLGINMIAHANLYCEEMAKKHNMKIVLEETPAESASQRLCHADLKNHKWGELAMSVAKGDKEGHNCYYTNSIHLDNEAGVDYLKRIIMQSKFHPLIDGGAIVHAWVGENLPAKENIGNLVKKVQEKTQCSQLTISPEFSCCDDCGHTSLGLEKRCAKCKSERVNWYSRIVGYYSKIQSWSQNKKEELKHREKNYEI